MKDFRVAKCLDSNGINEYAIFSDGSRKKLIQNDEKYGKYFEVDNELNTDCTSLLRHSFTGRIKDAVDTIRNGNGDCIKSYHLFGRVDVVVYFLDRKIGEELRQKSIEGWKDTSFGWAIECGYKCSFSGYSLLKSNTETISLLDKEKNPITFNSKEEAKRYIEDLIERARYYARRISTKLSNVEDKEEREKIIYSEMDNIEEYAGTKHSVIQDFVFDMLTEDGTLKTFECDLDKMGYKIIQYVVK